MKKEKKKQNDGKKAEEKPKIDKKPTEKEVIDELTNTLQRIQAEFENYKKRVDKEKAEFVKYSKAELIQRILPTIDTFEIALRSTKDNEKFVKGMEMVYAQLISLLHAEGLKPIESLGKKFDPYLHEVMLKEKSDDDDGIVLEELQKGYMLNDKVLRHSKVKVSEKENKK
ncbi:MAG: nucleotide exchange factor GrpE [Nanoarchaeota archaeon]|nr:nucleotide exchange factor GrpE [Nanoarchaeota archaeon]